MYVDFLMSMHIKDINISSSLVMFILSMVMFTLSIGDLMPS